MANQPNNRCSEDADEGTTETDVFYSRFNPVEEYKMNNERRGIALVFNHEIFRNLRDRPGTNVDRDNLRRRLTEQGFEVSCFDNLMAKEIIQKMRDASTADHSDADCFLCVFLSHGEKDFVYAYDTKIEIQTLSNMFKGAKCPSLAGKPKIFIIQACRGEEFDGAVLVADSCHTETDIQNEIHVDAAAVYTLPAGADFLMCYAVAEGYVCIRETLKGSWYIRDLCDMLRRYGSSLEILELLTLVNRKVSHRGADISEDGITTEKKQVPCFASMLTKKMYLRPKTN